MRINRTLLFILLISGLCTSCDEENRQKAPDNLIAEDKYIDLLVDLQLIRTHYNSLPEEVNLDSLLNVIYENYNVTEEQFLESNTYYQQQVEAQIKRSNEALRRLRLELTKIDSLNLSESGN